MAAVGIAHTLAAFDRTLALLEGLVQLVDTITQTKLLLQQDAEVARVRSALGRGLAPKLEGEARKLLLVLPPRPWRARLRPTAMAPTTHTRAGCWPRQGCC